MGVRSGIALAVSATTVLLIATLLPRAFLVNDDPGLVLNLRMGMFSPWMSPVLNRGLASSYASAPDVPWFGLYQYGLLVLTGAVLIHTCIERIDRRGGVGTVATWAAAIILAASHSIVVIGITWTAVSMSAVGTALVAFVAELQTCHASGTPASGLRALAYGLLLAGGFMLRPTVIIVAGAALFPFLVYFGIRLLRARYVPRLSAAFAFLAPLALVVAVQGQIPQPGAQHEEFNRMRGYISEYPAFARLDTRAPEILERAGWTVDEYHDFSAWLLADDTEFSTEKLRRLRDTGGVPPTMKLADYGAVLRGIVRDSAASVWLFVAFVGGALVLAFLGAVERRRVLLFSLGNLAFLTVIPLVMSALARFPQRLSLSYYTIAAFGMFVFLADELTRRERRTETVRRAAVPLVVLALVGCAWGYNLVRWAAHGRPSHPGALREFAERVQARNGIVMTGIGIGEMDPLVADPRGYDALPSGWGTFTAPWFAYIERFGIHSGSELLHKMIDNPNAYFVANPDGHETFLGWIRRRVKNSAVRLSLVDSAFGLPTSSRPELYRLVTTPLEQGSDEWKLRARKQWELYEELANPPRVADVALRPITFVPPYDAYVSQFGVPTPGGAVSAVDGGIRYELTAIRDQCPEAAEGGIHIPVRGLAAVRFHLEVEHPENIWTITVFARSQDDRAMTWHWYLGAETAEFGLSGPVTLVPGHPALGFQVSNNTARPDEIRDLHFVISVKPGTQGALRVRNLEIAAP